MNFELFKNFILKKYFLRDVNWTCVVLLLISIASFTFIIVSFTILSNQIYFFTFLNFNEFYFVKSIMNCLFFWFINEYNYFVYLSIHFFILSCFYFFIFLLIFENWMNVQKNQNFIVKDIKTHFLNYYHHINYHHFILSYFWFHLY